MDRERLKRDVERIEKHRQEKAAVAKSEREIFAALKGDGFNCKVVREILKRRAMDDSEGWDAEVATYEAAVQSLELAAERVREGATYEQAATEHNVRKADLHHFVQATAVPETEIPEHDAETGEITETADRKPPGDSSERDGEGSSSGEAVATFAAPETCVDGESVHLQAADSIVPRRTNPQTEGASTPSVTPVPEEGEGTGTIAVVSEPVRTLYPDNRTNAVWTDDADDLTPPPHLDRRKVAA